jgi:hypothetical protein
MSTVHPSLKAGNSADIFLSVVGVGGVLKSVGSLWVAFPGSKLPL